MKADFVAKITDDLAKMGKDQDQDSGLVSELTPQARLLAEMAKQAAVKPIEGDWDIKPHPLIAAAAPTREQFDAEDTAPVVVMRNPIAGHQVIDNNWLSFTVFFLSTCTWRRVRQSSKRLLPTAFASYSTRYDSHK